MFAHHYDRGFQQGKILAEDRFHLEELYGSISVIMEDSSLSEVNLENRGQTDVAGTDNYNQVLSIQEANSVGEYLNRKGITADKKVLKGLGENKTLESNEGRFATRRRIDLIIGVIKDAYKDMLYKEFIIKK